MSLCTFSNFTAGSIDVPLTGYQTGFEALVNFAQLQSGLVYYPYKSIQDGLVLSVQCPSEEFYDKLQKYVASCMRSALNSSVDQSVRVFYPSEYLDVKGYFTQMPGGAKRWDWTPRITIQMVLVVDYINTLTGFSSYTVLPIPPPNNQPPPSKKPVPTTTPPKSTNPNPVVSPGGPGTNPYINTPPSPSQADAILNANPPILP